MNQKLRSLDGKKNISKTQNIFKCTPFASCYGILLWQGIVNATEMNHLDVCVRMYVCVWISASYAFHSNQTKENHKLYESKNDSNIYAYLRFQWNDSTQLKKKRKKESRFMYIPRSRMIDFVEFDCLQGIYFPTSVDFALMTSFTILFCLWTFVITFIQHFNWMVLVLDIAAIPCPFTVYHTIFMCSNIKWTTINN